MVIASKVSKLNESQNRIQICGKMIGIVSYEYQRSLLMHPACIAMSKSLSGIYGLDLAAMVDIQHVNQGWESFFPGVESIMHAYRSEFMLFRVKSVQCHRIRSKRFHPD